MLQLLLADGAVDIIEQMDSLTTQKEAVIRRLAAEATEAMSSEARCYVIQGGLYRADESDVICSMPTCGERFSAALPSFITSSMWGTTGRTQGATCSRALGDSPSTCGCCTGMNLYFDKPSTKVPQGFRNPTTCTASNQLARDDNCQTFMDIGAGTYIDAELKRQVMAIT